MQRHVRCRLRIDDEQGGLVRAKHDEGAALVVVLLVSALLFTVGLSVVLVADVDTLISGSYRDGVIARYAAEAVGDAMVTELAAVDDWTPILAGATSAFWGSSASAGTVVDAASVTAALQQQTYGGTPWGANTPRWRLFGRGDPGHDLFTGGAPGSFALVWVSDDVAETDGDPLADENDTVAVYVRVWGPGRARADAQRVIRRVEPGVVRLVSTS
jgi:hypothetical protein